MEGNISAGRIRPRHLYSKEEKSKLKMRTNEST